MKQLQHCKQVEMTAPAYTRQRGRARLPTISSKQKWKLITILQFNVCTSFARSTSEQMPVLVLMTEVAQFFWQIFSTAKVLRRFLKKCVGLNRNILGDFFYKLIRPPWQVICEYLHTYVLFSFQMAR
jgi:hypothetical protein